MYTLTSLNNNYVNNNYIRNVDTFFEKIQACYSFIVKYPSKIKSMLCDAFFSHYC